METLIVLFRFDIPQSDGSLSFLNYGMLLVDLGKL